MKIGILVKLIRENSMSDPHQINKRKTKRQLKCFPIFLKQNQNIEAAVLLS